MDNKYRNKFLIETSDLMSRRISDVQKEYVSWLEKRLAMCESNLNDVLDKGWYKPEKIPEYYRPIIMLISTDVLGSTHGLYIAGHYHTDNVWVESCGGNMDQEFDNYKLKAWTYITGPAFI